MKSTLLFQSSLKSLTFCKTCYFWVLPGNFFLEVDVFLGWKVHKNHEMWWELLLSVCPLLVLLSAAEQFSSMYIEHSDHEHWATNNFTVVRCEHCEKLEQWYRLNLSLILRSEIQNWQTCASHLFLSHWIGLYFEQLKCYLELYFKSLCHYK